MGWGAVFHGFARGVLQNSRKSGLNREEGLQGATKRENIYRKRKEKYKKRGQLEKHIYKKRYKYQKAGIIFSGLSDVDIYKKNLFSLINSEEKRKRLIKAIDYANIKYGRQALSIAQAGLKKKWNIKRQHSSKIDTACFDFLPVIRVS